jgi:KipI family sensor histidine kinase inhibitor
VTRVRPAGDAALLVEAEGRANRLAAAISAERGTGVLDVVPGATTVLVTTEPGLDLARLAERILALPLPEAGPAAPAAAEIPVVYDGDDLAEVARLTGLSPDEVVARHTAAEYTVGWMGFSPGFGYLTGLDPALARVPRLAEPRLRVPAGSVAIAGGLAAVYSTTSPGGWRLLGRTTAVLWDPHRDPPALLTPGLRVRFRPVSPVSPVSPLPPAAPPPPAAPAPLPSAAPDPPNHDRGGSRAIYAADPPRSWIEVVRPGILATVQDLGRPGFGHLGVPRSGAADEASLRLANHLVGNPETAAALELTLGRATFRFPAGATVAVTGAPAPVTMTEPDTAPAGATADPADGARVAAAGGVTRDAPHGAAFEIPPGGEVAVGAPRAGLRCYLAVRGGIDVPPVLGSRSADLRSGLGPAPLRRGDQLPVGPAPEPEPGEAVEPAAGATADPGTDPGADPGTEPAADPGTEPAADPGADPARATATLRLPAAGEAAVLRVIAGPRDDWFAPEALDTLCAGTYTVTQDSDRTGLRLDGPVLPRARDGELPSEGLATGSLQIPPSGRPILMLADHPVTGGYPVIAVVTSADIPLAAQLRPGSRITFALTRP